VNRSLEFVDIDSLVIDSDLDRYNLTSIPSTYAATEDFGEIDERLRLSLQQAGMREPLLVKELGDGKWLLVDGYRRIRQIRYLLSHDGVGEAIDVHKLPCYVLRESSASVPLLRSEVNERRQNLPPGLLGQKFRLLRDQFHMSTTNIARKFGFTQPSITHYLAIAECIKPVIDAIDDDKLPMTAGRVFWVLTEEGQETLWQQVQEIPSELRWTRDRLVSLAKKLPSSMFKVPEEDRMRRARPVLRAKKSKVEERGDTRRWLQEDLEQIDGEVDVLGEQLKEVRLAIEPWARAWAVALKSRAVRDYMREHESGRLADVEEILRLELGDWSLPKD
jgi:ParB-like chromosome segregation protein Spo0J